MLLASLNTLLRAVVLTSTGRSWRRRPEKMRRRKGKRRWRSLGGRRLQKPRRRKGLPPAAVRARTARKRSAEGKRRTRGKAGRLQKAKTTDGEAGAEKIEGEEAEVDQEVTKAGEETTAEKIREGAEAEAGGSE